MARRTPITIAVYTVRVREKHTSSYERLDRFDGRVSLLDFIEQHLRGLSRGRRLDEVRELQRTSQVRRRGHVVTATVLGGEYGFAAEGRNAHSHTISYRRLVDDAELIPFYAYFEVPPRSKVGLMLIQRFGVRSVFGSLRAGMNEDFAVTHEDYLIETFPFVPTALRRVLEEGVIREIEITTRTPVRDITDRYSWMGNIVRNARVVSTTKIRPERGRARQIPASIRQLFERRALMSADALEEDSPDDLGGVTLTVDYKGRQRRMHLDDPKSLTPLIDVTGDVTMEDGHPTQASIASAIRRVRDEIAEDLDFEEVEE